MTRVFVVDDEPLARRRIKRLLRVHADMDVVGECDNGQDAIAGVTGSKPDLLFLDVQMPELDGFGLLDALSGSRPAAVIFTTAFEEHAVHAFEVHALDYLVKPFTRARFDAALDRARGTLLANISVRGAREALRDIGVARELSRLVVRKDGRAIVIDVDDITWIEAERNNVRAHTSKGTFAVNEPISVLETKLDRATFVRVHRSAIVNVRRISEVQPWFHGDAVLVMHDGSKVRLSRTHRARVSELLGNTL
jgi:two-component system LytT family response regulator